MQRDLHKLIRENKKIIVIHHWDSDGIASAAKILQLNSEAVNYCPRIGLYRIDNKIMRDIDEIAEGEGRLVILDWNIPFKDMLRLIDKGYEVIYVDHHYKGEKLPRDVNIYYKNLEGSPSTTWTLTKLLQAKIKLTTIIGIFGDLEERVTKLELYNKKLLEVMRKNNWRKEDILKLSRRLNMLGQAGERKKVKKAAEKLSKLEDQLEELLKIEEWIRCEEKVLREIEEIMKMEAMKIGTIRILKFKSDLNITATIARRMAKKYRRELCMAVNLGGRVRELYLRVGEDLERDLTEIIDAMKSKGYTAGGKRRVMGVQVEKGNIEECLEDALKILEVKKIG